MKTRIISAIVALVLLFAVLFSGRLVFAITVFALAVIAGHEFMNAGITGGFKPFKPIVYLSSLIVLVSGLKGIVFDIDFHDSTMLTLLMIYSISASVLSILVFKFGTARIEDAGFTLLTIFYVIFMFSFVPLIRNMENGIYLIWVAFIGAWGTDTFAYFVGVTLGKHKNIIKVSTSKSLEGIIGGIAGCVILTALFGYYLTTNNIVNIKFYHFIILGFLNGMLSQIGDWIASAVKRYVNVKDYGKIMPGHGGILDRFDSILFISPIIFIYLTTAVNFF